MALEGRVSLARFAEGVTLTSATLILGVGGGSKISANVMDALLRWCREAMGLCFRFLSDVRCLSFAPENGVVDGQGRGVCTWACATGRATTGLLVNG